MLRTIFFFLHGKTPHPFDVVSVYLLGALFGLMVLYSQHPLDTKGWILAFLAADISGGIISNATASTRQHWREQSTRTHQVFLLIHLGIHPLIILLINGFSNLLSIALLIGLLAKVLLFVAGQRINRS